MARSRSAKDLAQRVDRDYFKKPDPAKRAMRFVLLLALGGVVAFVAYALLPQNRLWWSRGAVRPAHGFVENDCGACHGPLSPGVPAAHERRRAELLPLGGWQHERGPVSEAKCSSCHQGMPHHVEGPPSPGCQSCHTEHDAPSRDESACVSCHAALATTWPKTGFRDVSGFPSGHPEFRALAAADTAKLALNHDVHLWPGLRGPNGPEPLGCASCHAPNATQQGFLPVEYEKHCGRCHTLALTEYPTLAGRVVPHGDVAQAFAFLERALPSEPGAAANAQARAALEQLSKAACERCHQLTKAKDGSLAIEPVAVRRDWMPQARFDHRNHRELGCGACHQNAEVSRSTADVLLPGKDLCGSCHAKDQGAPFACDSCHRYHLPDDDPYGPGTFTLPE